MEEESQPVPENVHIHKDIHHVIEIIKIKSNDYFLKIFQVRKQANMMNYFSITQLLL